MSTKRLSCDNRYRFFETVLQVPVMCGRQLNSSSILRRGAGAHELVQCDCL